MFPNLNAEQARQGKSNSEIASLLGMSRTSYENKKQTGQFSLTDANTLCDYFQCEYRYLFGESILIPRSWELMENRKEDANVSQV